MNCIIIEDQPPAQRILKKYIDDIGTLTLKATFSNALEAMEFLKSERVDLIFLDIHLPKISGIDFLKMMPQHPFVILTTAFSNYALESYEFNVVDYLLKPFSFQRFVKAVSKIPQNKNNQVNEEESIKGKVFRKDFFIKSGYEYVKISIDDIIMIKSDTDYTEIHTLKKKYLSSESLKYWEENLDNNLFVRVHKSYIIKASNIEKVSGNQVYLVNNNIVPIGRAFKENFIEKFIQ